MLNIESNSIAKDMDWAEAAVVRVGHIIGWGDGLSVDAIRYLISFYSMLLFDVLFTLEAMSFGLNDITITNNTIDNEFHWNFIHNYIYRASIPCHKWANMGWEEQSNEIVNYIGVWHTFGDNGWPKY